MKNDKHILDHESWADQYSDLLFKFTVVRVNDRELAKDIVQDTFLSALKNRANFRGEVSEKNWLFTVLKHKIIDHYRSKARSIISTLNESVENKNDFFDEEENWLKERMPAEWQAQHPSSIESKEFYLILERCKNKLKKLQKLVFTMKYLDDLDSDKICKDLGISSSNYWVLIHRAKLQMRQCLEINWFKV